MEVVFGQERKEAERTSPNGGCIRTEEGGKRGNESEWRPYSDRRGRKRRERVRMEVAFGQTREEERGPSPNASFTK
jgi:hypothetical protein